MIESIIIHLTSKESIALGKYQFLQMPRIGELIEIPNSEGIAYCYDVIQLIHSSLGLGSDIYVANPRESVTVRSDLQKSFVEK